MISAAAETHSWSRARWYGIFALIFLGQLVLIFWLSRNGPTTIPKLPAYPHVFRATEALLSRPDLDDPTLFVLPNIHGFSGNVWLKNPPLEYEPPEWTEPVRPLALAPGKLGNVLGEFVRTNLTDTFELAGKPEPQLDIAPPPVPLPTQSTVTIKGTLAKRPLLSKFKLDSRPAAEILPDSEVQVGVDADGTVFSAIVVSEPTDSKEAKAADAAALNLTRSMLFQPFPRNDPRRTDSSRPAMEWGRIIFHWHTVAPPETNATTANP